MDKREIKQTGLLELIKELPTRKVDKNWYRFGLFRCPECRNEIEKILKDGLRANYCSHECYAKNRELRGNYKPSVIISGYRYILVPSHPSCNQKGYVAEHRLVAEKTIGRYLHPDEIAHHINENKLDNRPENIQVMTKSEHSKHHQNFRKCKIAS